MDDLIENLSKFLKEEGCNDRDVFIESILLLSSEIDYEYENDDVDNIDIKEDFLKQRVLDFIVDKIKCDRSDAYEIGDYSYTRSHSSGLNAVVCGIIDILNLINRLSFVKR